MSSVLEPPGGRVGRKRTGRKLWKVSIWVTPEDRGRVQHALEKRGQTAGAVARDALLLAAGLPPRPDDEPEEG